MANASLAVLILLAFPLLLLLFAFVDEQRPNEPTTPYGDLLMRQARTHRDIPTHRGERERPTSSDLLTSFDPTYYPNRDSQESSNSHDGYSTLSLRLQAESETTQ